MAKKLQIEHLLDRKPTQLSGGQQQRVAMCRALVKEPSVLLLDEPMSNLDARLKIEIREVIKKIQTELKVTSIIVTHDQEEAMAIADRIAILDNGRIQQFDTPQHLYNNPANQFVANFMGNPPMNFLQASIVKTDSLVSVKVGNHFAAIKPELQMKLTPHIGKKVVIGARSHQLCVTDDADGALPMDVSMAENLGKELLITGSVNGDHMRLSIEDTTQFERLRKKAGDSNDPIWLRFGDVVNVFDWESKVNLAL